MKFEVTHPKIWKKLAEKNIPMKHKIQIYEKFIFGTFMDKKTTSFFGVVRRYNPVDFFV